MDRKQIKKILRSPYKDIIEYLLTLVNLSVKELEVIREVDIKGYTEEHTAECLDVSTRYVQLQRAKAYKKMEKVWSSNHLVSLFLKDLEEE